MYIQEMLSFYSSLSTNIIFFRSLVSIFPLTRTWTYVHVRVKGNIETRERKKIVEREE